MRTIYGFDRLEHTNHLFYDLHSFKCPDIVRLEKIIFMFNAYNNNLPNNLQNLFVKRTPLYYVGLRRTHQFMRENVRTNVREWPYPYMVRNYGI